MHDQRRHRHVLAVIAAAPVLAAAIGSAFNIWYNVTQIDPLLTDGQRRWFDRSVTVYNGIAYPVLIAVWLKSLFSIRLAFRALRDGKPYDSAKLTRARVRAINLPWHIAGLLALGWGLCIPALLFGLHQSSEPIEPRVLFHLPTSIVIAALITITHAFFLIELLRDRLLFPVLFQDVSPTGVPGAITLPLPRRNLLNAIAVCVCPILSLVLLTLVDSESWSQMNWFTVYVGGVGVVLGLFCSWMLSRYLTVPIETLRAAAHQVAAGDLDVNISLRRSDEFGPLIDEFNHMVEDMRAKRDLRRRFGLHVGRRAAELILSQDPGLSGTKQDITVMFCDIRHFTARCTGQSAEETVSMLNRFLTRMVDVVENRQYGIVNKFLGDGFMALFGIGESTDPIGQPRNHAQDAVVAGLEMIGRLDAINADLAQDGIEELSIGIGVHTGMAIVGSMGSQDRLEYTAIGDTVNIASRVEGLTKAVDRPLLMTEGTRNRLDASFHISALPPQQVKGQPQPLRIFTVERQPDHNACHGE